MNVASFPPGLALLALLSIPPATSAAPAGEEFSAMLMKQCIEAYSEAGARGDQKTADALQDDDVLFAGGDGSVERDEKRDRDDAAAATLKQQTLAWRHASLMGDVPAMRRWFASDLLAIDEDGKVTEGTQFHPAAGLPIAGTPSQNSITDWVVHHDGRFAVTSYLDERIIRYGGQVLRRRSRLVDTWTLQDGEWQLAATHATPLFDDAPAASLPTAVPDTALDAYAGTYLIGAGARVVMTRDGDTLLSSVNGGKPTRYVAELPDLFYAAGSPPGSARTHLVFHRDGSGRITGYASSSGLVLQRDDVAAPDTAGAAVQGVESHVLPAAQLRVHRFGDMAVATFIHERVTQFYGQTLHAQYRSTETWVKRGDTWKMLSLQSRALERALPVQAMAARDAREYAGRYAAGAGVAGTIAVQDGALMLRLDNGPALRLEQVVRDDFAIHDAPGTAFVFQRNAAGRVTGYVARREGRDLQFARVGA